MIYSRSHLQFLVNEIPSLDFPRILVWTAFQVQPCAPNFRPWAWAPLPFACWSFSASPVLCFPCNPCNYKWPWSSNSPLHSCPRHPCSPLFKTRCFPVPAPQTTSSQTHEILCFWWPMSTVFSVIPNQASHLTVSFTWPFSFNIPLNSREKHPFFKALALQKLHRWVKLSHLSFHLPPKIDTSASGTSSDLSELSKSSVSLRGSF